MSTQSHVPTGSEWKLDVPSKATPGQRIRLVAYRDHPNEDYPRATGFHFHFEGPDGPLHDRPQSNVAFWHIPPDLAGGRYTVAVHVHEHDKTLVELEASIEVDLAPIVTVGGGAGTGAGGTPLDDSWKLHASPSPI